MRPLSVRCIAVLAVCACACGTAAPGVDAKLSAMSAEQAHADARLAETNKRVADSERRAGRAEKNADHMECVAKVRNVEAEVSQARSSCANVAAGASECRARNAAHTSTLGVSGCIAGIAVAALTAGSGAGLALAGCGGGLAVGEVTTDDCPLAPSCEERALTDEVLERHSNANDPIPSCGARLGVRVEPSDNAYGTFLAVTATGRDTTAASAGLVPGDVIVAINDVNITSDSTLNSVKETIAVGAQVVFSVARGSKLWSRLGRASRLGLDGDLSPTFRVGIASAWVNSFPLLGAKVGAVVPGSPADRAGLLPGDIIIALNDTPVMSPNGVIWVLDHLSVPGPVQVMFVRGGIRSVMVTPEDPGEP